MIESEKTKVGNLEERVSAYTWMWYARWKSDCSRLQLRILESARLSASTSTTRTASSGRSTRPISNTSEDTSSKISDINMKDLSILQRKKVMQLKAKRDRLEREMARLGRWWWVGLERVMRTDCLHGACIIWENTLYGLIHMCVLQLWRQSNLCMMLWVNNWIIYILSIHVLCTGGRHSPPKGSTRVLAATMT